MIDDLIYRQDAIHAVGVNSWAGHRLKKVPSALEVIPREVIPCKECKWHGYLTCSNPEGLKGWVTDNDFCSYVKKRKDSGKS